MRTQTHLLSSKTTKRKHAWGWIQGVFGRTPLDRWVVREPRSRILPIIYNTSDPSKLTAADFFTTPDLENQDLQMAREENHLVELEDNSKADPAHWLQQRSSLRQSKPTFEAGRTAEEANRMAVLTYTWILEPGVGDPVAQRRSTTIYLYSRLTNRTTPLALNSSSARSPRAVIWSIQENIYWSP